MQKRLLFLPLLIVALFVYRDVPAQEFPYYNSFKTSSTAGIVLGGDAKLTSNNGDPLNAGVLRLTDNTINQTGYCYIDQTFPVAKGLKIEFEFFTWGGNQADGITFFLFAPSGDFEAGQFGGGLGYSQKLGKPGMKGGFLAIGIDEYGNFGVTNENKSGGFKDINGNDYSTRNLNGGGSISVRGAVGPNGERVGSSAYPFIGGKITGDDYTQPTPNPTYRLPSADFFNIATNKRTTSENDPEYRKVRLDIQKLLGTNTGFNVNAEVFIGGSNARWIKVLDNVIYQIEDSRIPLELKGGFSGSTGDQRNNHEIRNVLITPSASSLKNPLAVQDEINTLINTTKSLNIISNNDNPKVNSTNGDFLVGSVDLDPSTNIIDSKFEVVNKGTFAVDANGLVTFTPALGYTGEVTAEYTFKDNYGMLSNKAPITAKVIAPKPTVDPIAKSPVQKNTKITFSQTDFGSKFKVNNVLATPTSVRFSSLPAPAAGELRLNGVAITNLQVIPWASVGSIEFVPAINYIGPVNFEWNGYNGTDWADNVAAVSLTFLNTKPVVQKTSETVVKNKTLSPLTNTKFNISPQYSDANNDPLVKIKITKLPAKGVLKGDKGAGMVNLVVGDEILAANLATIAYVPNTNSIDPDSFNWQATDGTEYSTDAVVSLTISNTVPTVNDLQIEILEDNTYTFTLADFQNKYTDTNNDALNKIQITSLPSNGTLKYDGVAITVNQEIAVADIVKLTFEPAKDFFGDNQISFSWKASDGTAYSTTNALVKINVKPVNDPPAFTKGQDQAVDMNTGVKTVAGWATGMSTGPNESTQSLIAFNLTNDNPGLFSAQPALTLAGQLTFEPAPGAAGKAVVTVVLEDNGGTADGGKDKSSPVTFTLNVKPIGSPDADITTIGNPKSTPVLDNDVAKGVAGIIVQAVSPTTKQGTTKFQGGKVIYTPASTFIGKDTYTYTLAKDGVVSDPITVTINVKPVGTADNDYVQKNSSVTTNVKTNDGPSGTGTTIVITKNPLNGTPRIISNSTGTIEYTPNANYAGTDTYGYKLVTSDGVESDEITVTISVADLQVEKTVSNLSDGTKAGSVISYEIKVKNTGTVTLAPIVVRDDKAPITSGETIASLAPGATASIITTSYAITQTDVDAGKVSNVAVAKGTLPDLKTIEQVSDANLKTPAFEPTETTITAQPKLAVEKKVKGQTNGTQLGSVITYEIAVTNTGNVTLAPVKVEDPKAPITTGGTIAKLEVGKTEIVTTTYTITQADIDAGKISNVAKAIGTPPVGTPVEQVSDADLSNVTPDEPTDIIIAPEPKLTVFKKVKSYSDGTKVNSVITYDIEVKNTGNVTLSPVTVTDSKAPIVSGGTIASLEVGETVVVSTTYTITQADVDAGKITNVAKAVGKPPVGAIVEQFSDADLNTVPLEPTDVTITPEPKLQVYKRVKSLSNGVSLGSVITYEIAVKNVGNVTLSSVKVTDDKAPITSGDAVASLAVGASMPLITTTYTITQSDIDAGKVSNVALAVGTPPSGPAISQPSDSDLSTPATEPTETVITPDPRLSVLKRVKGLSDGLKAGSVITYEILVKNTGNVGLTQVQVTDDKAPITSGGTLASLSVGASMPLITTTYTITQADIDAGKISNVAVAVGTPPTGPAIRQLSDADLLTSVLEPTETIIPSDPQISLHKTVKSLSNGTKVGSVISYEIEVKNTGNVTLSQVTVTDSKAPIASGGTIAKLDPGASVILSTTYTIKQEDVDAGKVSNVALAVATPPTGPAINQASDSDLSTPVLEPTETIISADPKLSVFKKVKSSTNGNKLGSVITYEIEIKNTGNVTLSPVKVEDLKAPISSGGTIASLAVGATSVITTTYTITQADIDAGKISNVAVATGTPPVGPPVVQPSDSDLSTPATEPTDITIDPTPSISVTKEITGKGPYILGSSINYLIKVTNTGNVTLTNVTVTDPNAAISSPGVIASLAPGATSTAITAAHIVTQADIDARKVSNIAYATGTPPTGPSLAPVPSDNPLTPVIGDPTEVKVGIDDPVAVADHGEVENSRDLIIKILDNDTSDESLKLDPASVVIVANPTHGTLKVNPDGSVTYTPEGGYIGRDQFTYQVKDDMGNITNVALVSIKVIGYILPNVFTPNGDGKNDTFVIVGAEDYDSADLTIYNRWGNEVYRNPNYQSTWTGEGLNAGTYYFVVKLKKGSNTDVKKGWVLIKR
ncbi:DUF7507 domain-containing protein [Desertivirga arenae]|uniref:DUF7507 domain-containing protein n=1 Tax=Desertivirga arenae TaxID=2810309 RepID=UPI001A96FABF|nr:tandem-95 repeat protein [Pedobacter sp. SYSU D00823]